MNSLHRFSCTCLHFTPRRPVLTQKGMRLPGATGEGAAGAGTALAKLLRAWYKRVVLRADTVCYQVGDHLGRQESEELRASFAEMQVTQFPSNRF
eukprot:2518585-Rhodomonas_salina.1